MIDCGWTPVSSEGDGYLCVRESRLASSVQRLLISINIRLSHPGRRNCMLPGEKSKPRHGKDNGHGSCHKDWRSSAANATVPILQRMWRIVMDGGSLSRRFRTSREFLQVARAGPG